MTTATDLAGLLDEHGDGVHWTLEPPSQLNANLVRLDPGSSIDPHVNDEVDVLIVCLAGRGHVTAGSPIELHPGVVAHIPRGEQRSIEASLDGQGLGYLTVHSRRGRLGIGRVRR